jgi:hypothetical protein
MSRRTDLTCEDCYFKQALLCALVLESTCPTFRHSSRGRLVPPQQPRLVPKPAQQFAAAGRAA